MIIYNEQEFGNRLRVLRKKMDYTQEALAEELDIDTKTYSNYERGQRNPPLSKLVLLADLLDTSTDYLLMGTEPDAVSTDCFSQKLDNVLSIVSKTADKLGVRIGD